MSTELIQVDQNVLRRYGLDATTSELLLSMGLPLKLPEDSTLVQFRSPEIIRVHDADALVIGSEPWEEDLWISLSPTGEVLAVGDGGPKRVNRGLLDFLDFLEAYVEFQECARLDDRGPVIYAQGEMQERLAAFRRGGLPRNSSKSKFDRPRAIKDLVARWKGIDPDALKRGSWWSVILEQLKDGLI